MPDIKSLAFRIRYEGQDRQRTSFVFHCFSRDQYAPPLVQVYVIDMSKSCVMKDTRVGLSSPVCFMFQQLQGLQA